MNSFALPLHSDEFDFDQPDLGLDAPRQPPVAFRESWRVLPLPRERNMVIGLLSQWTKLAGEASRPNIEALDPTELPVPWRNCSLSRRETGGVWRTEYEGEEFLESGSDPEQRLNAPLRKRLAHWFDLTLEAGRPLTIGGGFRRPDGRQKRFRAVLLPFDDMTGKITHLLAASTARDLLCLELRHLPIEAHAYIDGFWVRQAALP